MITLTSFVEGKAMYAQARKGERLFGPDQAPVLWSGARWAPSWASDWPVVEWVQPFHDDGAILKVSDFRGNGEHIVSAYYLQAFRYFWQRRDEEWIMNAGNWALCCWCPFSKKSQAQVTQFGTFVCHLGAVAKVLQELGVEWQFGTQHKLHLARTSIDRFQIDLAMGIVPESE